MKFARKFRPFTGFNIHEHHRQFMTVYLKKTRKFKINKKDIFEIYLRIVIAKSQAKARNALDVESQKKSLLFINKVKKTEKKHCRNQKIY